MKTLIFILLLGTSASYAQSEINEKVSIIGGMKSEVLATFGATPYRTKEHQVIKNYFVGLSDFASELEDNSRLNRRLNSYLSNGDMTKFCTDMFLDAKDWNQIKQNCTRNRFFLCSEEVNEFPEFKKKLSGSLNPENLEVFQNTPACK